MSVTLSTGFCRLMLTSLWCLRNVGDRKVWWLDRYLTKMSILKMRHESWLTSHYLPYAPWLLINNWPNYSLCQQADNQAGKDQVESEPCGQMVTGSTAQCTLYTVHYTMYTVHCTLYTICCTHHTANTPSHWNLYNALHIEVCIVYPGREERSEEPSLQGCRAQVAVGLEGLEYYHCRAGGLQWM